MKVLVATTVAFAVLAAGLWVVVRFVPLYGGVARSDGVVASPMHVRQSGTSSVRGLPPRPTGTPPPEGNVAARQADSTQPSQLAAAATAMATTSVAPSSLQMYPFPPVPFSIINERARDALVNIFCTPATGGAPISGSGVIIDPRGIILTNAHVAQYVLLSEDAQINLSCVVRTGSPAQNTWYAAVLYMPSVWVGAHASEINTPHPEGTGEHDYALLLVTDTVTHTPLPDSFPFLEYDTRAGFGGVGDSVLAASYPAEFSGNLGTARGLYANSSVTTIKQLLTFNGGTVDAFSLGGIIEAQSGSSGGAVVNAWDRLMGIITSMSTGATTADRDLRAISINYINTDFVAQTGETLDTFLAQNIDVMQDNFNTGNAPLFLKQYMPYLR